MEMEKVLESLHRKWESCERLANDPAAPNGEREAARTKAKMLRAKLEAMGHREHYDDYVKHGRQAVNNIHDGQWTLGALAYNVQIEHGKGRLQQYADDIGVSYSTLRHYRATWQAWPVAQGRPESYSVAEALNSHPDRIKIVAQFPNLTVSQAFEIMRLHKGGPQPRASASSRQQAQPRASTASQQAQPSSLEQAREAYLALALKLPMQKRTQEAVKLLNLLGVKVS